MSGAGLQVVWAYRRTGKFAFHVLSGALGEDRRTRHVPIEFAQGVDAVVQAATAARAAGRRVLVGWSFYSPDAERMFAELRAVRARLADAGVVHVAGGVHASAEPLATLRAGFDFVAAGEGERIVCDLVAALAAGGDPRTVPGVAWLADGRLARSPRPPRIALDDYPPFALPLARLGPIEITRGCVYACRFCQTPFFAGA
ncbi:MAG TPA: TIGR04013 family B12-binding domain/radical SAM domain-containing protein, partial [Planctomycetota bacterium]|nr:TIGR04013 family B12-binding domain/radical SAM domain-containing protein [Planctomycetota bacterium]